jgi:hypothetical protein
VENQFEVIQRRIMRTTYEEEKQRLKSQAQKTKQTEEEETAILTFFRLHAGEINPCQASRQACIRYFAGEEITLEALEDSWTNHPTFKKTLALDTEDDERARIEDRILELIQNSSPNVIADTKKNFRLKAYGKYVQTTDMLRARRDELERAAELTHKSIKELKAILTEKVNATNRVLTELPSEITRAQILMLWSPAEFKFWAKKCGGSMLPITKRINEKRN